MSTRPYPSCRLQRLTLGLGSVAAASGMALPGKADAMIVFNNDVLSVDGSFPNYLNLRFDPTGTDPIQVLAGTGSGIRIGGSIASNTMYSMLVTASFNNYPSVETITNSYTRPVYAFLGTGNVIELFTATQTFNIADPAFLGTTGTFAWFGGANALPFPTTSGPFYIGLRRKDPGFDNHFGWAKIRFDAPPPTPPFAKGQFTYLESAFNTDADGAIAVGQIPEPSSALLLAAGSTGLLASRRRRNKLSRGAA
jgi:hypothetical protein